MTNLHTSNFLIDKKKIIYLKRTGKKDDYQYWYWHQKFKNIVRKSKPSSLEIKDYPCYLHHPNLTPREFQIGDIIFHFSHKKFGILLFYQNGYWHVMPRKGKRLKCRTSSLGFISANLYGKPDDIEENLLGAQTQAELDFAERLGEFPIQNYIEKHLPNIPITEKTLIRLHYLMFKHIYSWAGRYRQEELVVGRYNSPTLEIKAIKPKISLFFQSLSKHLEKIPKDKISLTNILVMLHKELAWIHPFKDGNGRIIRLFSDLLALNWGYQLNWQLEKGKEKKLYQRTVRLAINRNQTKDLELLISRSLKKMD